MSIRDLALAKDLKDLRIFDAHFHIGAQAYGFHFRKVQQEIEDLQEAMNDESVMSDYEKLGDITSALELKQTELDEQYDMWATLSDEVE